MNDIISNLKFFFRLLDKGGYYVIEDFNHPKYFNYLNDSNNKELLVDVIIKKLKKKKIFKSKILSLKDQKYLFRNIKKINLHKGSMVSLKKNISDILFIEKFWFNYTGCQVIFLGSGIPTLLYPAST